MSIMSWNCRGLGNPWAVQALKRAIKKEDPSLVFLVETKLEVDEMKGVQQEIGLVQGIAVSSIGRSGGLALLWKSNMKVYVKFINRWYIDALIDSGSEIGIWRLTGFYGNLEAHKRVESWAALTRLGQRFDKPWVCIGDFNEVLSVNEKEGGAERASRQIANFRQCLDNNRLRDLGFTGSWFTWAVDRRDYGCIRARLDRAVANTDWCGIFPRARLYHRANSASDHCILLLKLEQGTRQERGRRLFRFESMWLKHEQCAEVVQEAWEIGSHMGRENSLECCLEQCRTKLTIWNSQVFGHVGKNIERIQGKLQALEAQAVGLSKQEQISETRVELNKLYAMEEDMWHQRSRSNWAKSGDKNTRYFLEKASNRKQKSTITGLMDESNQWQEDSEMVKDIAIRYYHKLFSSNQIMVQDELLEAIDARVSEPMNALLTRDFQAAEMRKALKQMHPLEAPGPDEGLSSLIRRAALEQRIHGISICRKGPQLSHLFFADDSLLFCHATIEECEELLRLLQVYELSTGQQLNREKTALFFSTNTPSDTQNRIKEMFGAEVIKQHEKYLGLPSLVGRSKQNTFQQVKERLANKLSGWKEKLLSGASKEVLIKAVAQAIPAHTMSCFLLPANLCDEMTSIVRNFWWGQKGGERKMAWMKWDRLCEPKTKGGLGFRDLRAFNLALLAKQGWRLQQGRNSLFYRVYKNKYFPDEDFIHAKKGHHPSFAWRSIWAAQSLISEGVRWQVGNGESISIWKDKWTATPSTYYIVSPQRILPMEAKVDVLIDAENGEWKADLIREVFLEHEADSILSIPLGITLPADKLVWTAAANGKFSVKSAYNLARSGEKKDGGERSNTSIMKRFWQNLWRAKVPNKVRVFGWKACQNILPTKMNLFHRQVTDDPICEECGLEPETVLHVLCHCKKAKEVWNHCRLLHHIEGNGDFTDVLYSNGLKQDQDSHLVHLILMIAWGLWRNRNERRFGGKNLTAAAIYGTAMSVLQEYYSAQEIGSKTRDVSPCRNKWTPPPHGWYKVNADGAVFSKQKWAGIGVIARDDQGRVVASMSKRLKVPLGAIEVEAKALEAAAGFAKDIGIQKVILESDSLVVCSAVQGAAEPPITIANIISSTIQIMQQLQQVEVQHLRRDGNRAAHGLARYAQNVNDFVTWMEETPTIINSEIVSDAVLVLQS